MRDSYLLAAGLLTGLVIPASALSHMSIILPANFGIVAHLKQNPLTTGGEKNLPTFDISLPEFSSQVFPPLEPSQARASVKSLPGTEITLPEFGNQGLPAPTESLLNPNTQQLNLQLTSGNQLYYQRLAALKTGQIYTRVDSDDLKSLWESAKKHQLTYEDWKSLLALEAKAIAQGQGTNRLSILIGDSLSMWFPKEKLPAGKLWLNQGISGDTSSGVSTRLAAFSQTRPDVIYIMAGINDLRKGASDELILRNYRRIIRRLRQTHPQTQIVIQSILPTRLPNISNSRIRHLNTQIALIAKQEKANYLNIHNWFIDFQGNLRPEFTTDGLHLSPDGYDVWRVALQQIELKLSGHQN